MFSKKKKEQLDKGKMLTVIGFFLLTFQALISLFLMLHPMRWIRFLKREKREIEELSTGKKDINRFCQDSVKLAKNLFIPNKGNNHKPKVLRPKSLITYALIAIVVKLVVTVFLFTTYPTPAQLAAIISSNIISLINESRIEAGVGPLKENNVLASFAQVKGSDMMERDYFAHDTPEGKKPWQWINKGYYDYIYAGENLAMDFTSAETVHVAFMKSPSHRRNILNSKYQEVGIAVLNGEMNGHQTILLVEFFGTQRKDVSNLAYVQPEGSEVRQATVSDENLPPKPVLEEPTRSPEVAGENISPPEVREPEPTPEPEPEPIPEPKVDVLSPEPEELQEVEPVGIARIESPEITDNELAEIEELIGPTPVSEGVIVVVSEQKKSRALVDLVIEYSNIFFIAFLIFILISLGLNIFVKIKVQDPSLILQSIAVIALLLAMILVKFHFAEQVSQHLLIL